MAATCVKVPRRDIKQLSALPNSTEEKKEKKNMDEGKEQFSSPSTELLKALLMPIRTIRSDLGDTDDGGAIDNRKGGC